MIRKSPFELEFQLKQHTPILHFQHDQDGATLRASEVKPKLDRFIIDELERCDINTYNKHSTAIEKIRTAYVEKKRGLYSLTFQANKPKSYLVASYIPNGKKEEYRRKKTEIINFAPYFADNQHISSRRGNPDNTEKKGIISSEVKAGIKSMDVGIIDLIADVFPRFLACQNFGTRQSKGFGGFATVKTTQQKFEQYLSDYSETIVFKRNAKGNGQEAIFKTIGDDYKYLKGGDYMKNRNSEPKHPAEIDTYMWEEYEISWEKEIVKEDLVTNTEPEQDSYIEDDKYQYVRALLGVAETYTYPKEHFKFLKEDLKVKVSHEEKLSTTKTDISRMRSPITFKVFNQTIYIIGEKIPKAIYGAVFRFTNPSTNKSILMRVPKSFGLEAFLEFALDEDGLNYEPI